MTDEDVAKLSKDWEAAQHYMKYRYGCILQSKPYQNVDLSWFTEAMSGPELRALVEEEMEKRFYQEDSTVEETFSEETIVQLERALIVGMGEQGACSMAGIDTADYYKLCNSDDAFRKRMEKAKAQHVYSLRAAFYKAALDDWEAARAYIKIFWED